MVRHLLFSSALALVATSAAALSLADAPVVFKSGNWSVLRATDAMSDKTVCTAIYKDDYGVQLTDHALFLHVRGGPEAFRLRFDDDPAGSLKIATDIQKKIDVIEVEGADFTRLLAAHRLRYDVTAIIGPGPEGDLDVTGIAEAVQNISNGCPGEPVGAAATPTKASAPGCSDQAKARLKAKGMSDADIVQVCAP